MHGEVWALQRGGHKVVVVSSDQVNELGWPPLVIPIVRAQDGARAPFMAATNDADPVSGVALVPEVGPCPPGQHTRVGMATGATMDCVGNGLRALFGLA